MDITRFTDAKTGTLARFHNVLTEKSDWLFIPNDMPPAWRFPERLWPLVSDAKEAIRQASDKLPIPCQFIERPAN